MKKKKITYVEKIILLLILVCSLYIVISIILLFVINNTLRMNILSRWILSCVILLLSAALILFVRKQAILPLKQNRILTDRFLQGQIYREYIDKTGAMYPGVEKVLNHMDTIINNKHLVQEAKRRSEFIALQNQINPHFLYNTLEAIRGDALSEGVDYIADITEALSTFFRYSVTDTGNLVTISDELENVNNYFKIQQYRFGEKLELIYESLEDEVILELMCPKLTLQPIIENAIFHGLEKRADKGSIRIRMEMTNNKLTIIIIDNGVGMDKDTLEILNNRLKQNTIAYTEQEDKNKKGGIALINVCRRIKLLFGENYGIHVYSIPEFGTDVRITLPIVKKNLEYQIERNGIST